MHLIVGLGNPGSQYERTRHNAGWLVLDELARRHGIEIKRKAFEARLGSGLFGERRVLLAKPQTYMNLSGRAVSAIARYHNIPAERILVVCDDLNLPLGRLRLRVSGSDGGHNGLKSIQELLGTREYPRLRFGVGEPPRIERVERGTIDYVLSPFEAAEFPLVERVAARAADCVETFVRDGESPAMNQFNQGEIE